MQLVQTKNLEEATHVQFINPHEKSGLIGDKLYDIRVSQNKMLDWEGNPYDDVQYYVIDENGKENFGAISDWSEFRLFVQK